MKVQLPHRAVRQRAFRVNGDGDTVFALFCPVREAEWLESWRPGTVYSKSGVIESGCVFTSADQNGRSIWLVSRHDPQQREVEMVRIAPGFTACLLQIAVRADGAGGCEVSVSYSYTALSDAGISFVDGFSEDAFTETMDRWQAALDHYLVHGSALPGS